MAEMSQQVEIPNRALFKAAEVCDLVKVQPYVLRSWESEFKDLGVSKGGSTTRVYRREDIELVLRIKHHLVFPYGACGAYVCSDLAFHQAPSGVSYKHQVRST